MTGSSEAALQLKEKKREWLEQRRQIEEQGNQRKQVADAFDGVPAEIKKLIAPMFHIRIVQQYLWEILEECRLRNRNFVDRLCEEQVQLELCHFRENFQEGGESRMQELEDRSLALGREIIENEEKKREVVPQPIDIHKLADLLTFAQACKNEGNEKYQEGLYEEALQIYSQGEEVMKQWKVDAPLKNERKWLTEYRLACLKNKAQAAIKLEMFQTGLDAAEEALSLDEEDHKAWYRKVQALKGLGRFQDAEDALVKLEDIAQWCPDRRQILRDCNTERTKLTGAQIKWKLGTRDMVGRAVEAGIFSEDRKVELEDATLQTDARLDSTKPENDRGRRSLEMELPAKALEMLAPAMPPEERKVQLTAALAGELMDELAEAYSQPWFQARVHKCARDSGFERSVFLLRLKDVAFKAQKPVLKKWGFEGNEQGVREMTAAMRDHAMGGDMPAWLKQKQDRCLELLYGGKDGGMIEVLLH
eukprot:CAMPEP_0172697806 /NCGR_PEP_ID=MMETSP1074-20121228/28996_1 /TAXON_ID=2916 /ORGANISM="Ceratium fusus, Strain PA161109" /LENGTH=475 /DNA_ID=CAMNT_0013518747 /DNA_START=18 /DNA_END=1445 /DNA_ORIENTATION=+